MIARVIRGAIGFDGLVMSDDLSMKALSGELRRARRARRCAAGCDVVLTATATWHEMTGRWPTRARRAAPAKAARAAPSAALARAGARRRNPSTPPRPGPVRRGLRRPVRRHERRTFQPRLDFEAARTAAEDGEALIVDLDGYEGPLHVLLALARRQKVDLLQLSITQLADQYLAFVPGRGPPPLRAWPPTTS